ncbi:predicted protein [Naegleria gruberi]|uniref:Predicted protein n=1 Tax=Naegleria gruberi TaxID=5762 RepID=D2W1C1_NAEGR|nr:uncharacterized protein NAEGRDRAFT_75164 [Naegleria gruberi]EFC37159.1 predicted protein [Naegleria gruberi]|eukprot:XP_002669903.1 predicted protein [Naegleria gruberi strain NEG-M]
MLKRTSTSLQPKRKFGGSLLSTVHNTNGTNSRATNRINHHVGCLFSNPSVGFHSTMGINSSSSSNISTTTTSSNTTTTSSKRTSNNNNIQSINIGNINLYSSTSVQEGEQTIEQELLIPNYSLFGEDVSQLDQQKDILSHLKWMAMKDKMKQDMFLIGHYGELKRHLAFTYCQLARRSVEYVCITKDTSEHDFKQRREIETGSAFYVDQAAVRAAKNGSVLILEGIEKADLNILPILNNLMENREMALESGTMLISPQRYKQLIEEEGKTPEELKLMKIEPVHEDFRIIAMGLPVPYYDGNTLDPPLRSRFNARVIDLPSMESIFSSLVNHRTNDQVLSFLSNEQKKSLFLSLIQFTQSIVHLDNMLMNSKDAVNTNSKTGSIELLPRFPIDNLKNLIEMLNDYRSIFASSVENVESLIHTLYPFELFMSREKDKSEDEKLEQNKMIEIIKEQLKECSTKIHEIISQDFSPASSSDQKQELIGNLLSQAKATHFKDIGFVLIEKHRQVLTEMMRSHLCGKDMCLIGGKGSGKSLISHAFASMVGYKAVVFPMYKEMTSKDLLQKRGTDSAGNTIWKNSVLIDSMIDGSLCILDGIDRMSTDILLSIQTLIQDRVLYLFNGNRYVSHEYYDKFLSQGFTKEELSSKGIYRIHEDFRIIAIGLNDSLKWLSLELFNLFHFHTVPKLSIEEEVDLLSSRVGADASSQNLINALIRIKNDYNNTEFNQDQRLISMRDLIRIVKRSMIFKDECILTAIERTTMTYLLPKHHLELLRKLAIKYKVSHNQNTPTDKPVHIEKTDTHIQMDDIKVPINLNANLLLVPKPYFVQTEQHAIVMKAMLKDHLIGDHSLLIGYQGVGKNKITDQFLNLLQCEREYMQLHRDITIASLTVQPSVVDGVLTYIDSPLVKAVRHGRILVLDEIDKAPLEVVSILKSLVEDGNMVLGDGRTIVTMKEYQKRKQQNDPHLHKLLPIMKGFRIIALSNPPTFPFHGNSFYDASGDIFSNHYVSNPRGDSEIKLLQSYGPDVPLLIIKKLSGAFDDLRLAVEEGVIQYPYSTRELVHIVKHLQAFPNEATLQDALANVFDFDSFDRETLEFLAKVFQKHEIPVSFNNIGE